MYDEANWHGFEGRSILEMVSARRLTSGYVNKEKRRKCGKKKNGNMVRIKKGEKIQYPAPVKGRGINRCTGGEDRKTGGRKGGSILMWRNMSHPRNPT